MAGSSKAVLAELLADASERRKEALSRLEKACDQLSNLGTLSLSEIESFIRRTFGDQAGPRAQSISNERNRAIGMYHYVEARKREMPKRAKPAPRTYEEVVEAIQDMDTRNSMRALLIETSVTRRSLERAKKLLKTIRPGVNIDDLIAGRTSSEAPAMNITEQMVRSTQFIHRSLTSDTALQQCGLAFDRGNVRRRSGTRDLLFDAVTIEQFGLLMDEIRQQLQS